MKNNVTTIINEICKILDVTEEPLSRRAIYEELLHKSVIEPNSRKQFDEVIDIALKHGELDKSKLKKTVCKTQRLPNVLRLREMKKLVNVIDDPKEMFIVLTAFFCGLRRSELANLRIDDLSIDDQNCMFLKVVQGKRKKDRFVTLAPAYVRILKLWLQYTEEGRTSEYLIPAKNGLKPINTTYLNTRFQVNCQKARILKVEYRRITARKACTGTPIKEEKMYNYHFHSLRHSYATFRIEAGDSPEMAMEEMGHKDRETLNIYTHISLEARQKATNKVFGYGRELPYMVKVRREEEREVFSYEDGQLELKRRQLEIEEKRLEIEKLKLLKEVNPFQIKKTEK